MRLSILSRLILGYVFLLVLAAGMSMHFIWQLGRVTDVTHSITFVDNALISLQKDMTDELLSETGYEKKYLILRDRELYKSFLKSRTEFEKNLSKALMLSASPEVHDALNRAAYFHVTYNSLFKEEVQYHAVGTSYDRTRYTNEKSRAVNATMGELGRVRTLSQQNILEKVNRLTRAGRQARTTAMVVSAVSLLLGLGLAVLITRSITRPLSEMQQKTKDIANGVFEADLKVSSSPEIGALAQAFNTMSSKLKEVDRMKSDFFALMSHELRTPLTSIKEGTNLVLEGCCGEVAEKQKKVLLIIAEESNRLIGLVNSVLDLAKLESGMLVLNFGKADLPPLIERAVKEVGPLAEAKHIRIVREVGDLQPLTMDAERMLQVLRNLIGNALKFTPRGGTVRITARREKNAVTVAVIDTGPGIPKEHATAIFDKFRQIPGTGRPSGTGLGLAIVKHIMQAHGGSVWVESEVGNGSTFTLQLPA